MSPIWANIHAIFALFYLVFHYTRRMENRDHTVKAARVAVVGGGISGLMAAKELVDKGFHVDLFEGDRRLGGKIQTAAPNALSGYVVNLGAEFMDSREKNPRMVGLCEQLGVTLVNASDQTTEQFHLPDGTLLSGEVFHTAYKPLAERVIADKANLIAAERWTERAKQLDAMTLKDYLQELAASIPGGVDPRIIETAARVYGSEIGRDPEHASALQFVNESSSSLGTFLNSDCAYRVEGGTEKIVDALRGYLTSKGVSFHTSAKINSLSKTNGQFQLGFESAPSDVPATFDKVVMALPSYALGKIEGLEALGVTTEQRALLQQAQYTHSAKFFVKLKEGATIDDACFFSGKGFQAWTSQPGMLTFLVGGETPNSSKGMKLVTECLDTYAKAHGKNAEDLFQLEPQHVVFAGPDTQRPCYCSPSKMQAIGLGGLISGFEKLAASGLGIVGTFLPRRSAEGMAFGFMECGAESAHRTAQIMAQPELAIDKHAADRMIMGPYTAAIEARRAATLQPQSEPQRSA